MAEDLLPRDSIVRERWHVEEKIGKGGFGQVYRCRDDKKNKLVALKLVPKNVVNAGTQQLYNEARTLRAVQGKKFFTRYYSYGRTFIFDFLVMELLGPNLKSLKKAQPGKKFSSDTTLSMGRMMVKSVEWLHVAGYLHRDIKPSNFAIGVKGRTKRVFLIDFGLSKRYVSESGELCALRNKVSFKGTARYASANVLRGKDAGRRDDLISLFYTLVELSSQKLPWRKINAFKELASVKESFDHSTLVSNFPAAFFKFFELVNALEPIQTPDYGSLLLIVEACLGEPAPGTSNSSNIQNAGIMQAADYLSDNSLSHQTISETTITGDVISTHDENLEKTTSCSDD